MTHLTTTGFLQMDEPGFVQMWFQCFAANARWKKLKDNKTGIKNEIMDLFLASTKWKTIMKILMICLNYLKDLIFKEISEIIKKNIRPKKFDHHRVNQVHVFKTIGW